MTLDTRVWRSPDPTYSVAVVDAWNSMLTPDGQLLMEGPEESSGGRRIDVTDVAESTEDGETPLERSERIPFDPETESLYCSRDGLKLEKSGHMFFEFMLCPRHGEFTMAPVVMREPMMVSSLRYPFDMEVSTDKDAGKWFIHTDPTVASMWSMCKAIDERHADGSPYDPRETRVM